MSITRSSAPVKTVARAAGLHQAGREFRNILVDLDSAARSQPALEMAAVLARQCGAGLRLVDSGKAAPAHLEAPHDLLLREVGQFGHDLVVRSRELDLVPSRAGRENVNQHLFRFSPCPVWAVGVRPKLKRPAILAAVNVFTHDPLTEELNASVLHLAARIAHMLEGRITVLHAWRQPAEERLHSHLAPLHFDALLHNTAHSAEEALRQTVASFGGLLRACRVELRRGAAERVIPRFVVDEGIDIVVAGARGERGIWPFVFGSTAERLLQDTTCSVVAAKPQPS
jgi:universal stress protein E